MNKKLFALVLVSAFALQLKAGEPGLSASAPAADLDMPAGTITGDGVDAPGDTGDGDLDDGSSVSGPGNKDDAADRSDLGSASPVKTKASGDTEKPADDSATTTSKGQGDTPAADSAPACTAECHVAQEVPGKNTNFGVLHRVLNLVWTPRMNTDQRKAIMHAIDGSEVVAGLNQAQMAQFDIALENLFAERSIFGIWKSRGSKLSRAVLAYVAVKVVRDIMNETENDEDEDEVEA